MLFRAHTKEGTLYIYKFIIVKHQERRIRWGVPKQPEKGEDKWAETEREHRRGSQNNCLCCNILQGLPKCASPKGESPKGR